MIARLLYRLAGNLKVREYPGGNLRYLVFSLRGAGSYLHVWRAAATGMHSHPWPWSFSIVMSGAYTEKRKRGAGGTIAERVVKAPAIVFLRDTDFHDVSVKPGTECWSLFFHPHASRVWYWLKEYRVNAKQPGTVLLWPPEDQSGEAADGTDWSKCKSRRQVEAEAEQKFSTFVSGTVERMLNRSLGKPFCDEPDNFPPDHAAEQGQAAVREATVLFREPSVKRAKVIPLSQLPYHVRNRDDVA